MASLPLLHDRMPTAEDLSSAGLNWTWHHETWWSLAMKVDPGCRAYLNAGGEDDELRFSMWHPFSAAGRRSGTTLTHPGAVRDLPCLHCGGSGRTRRPEMSRGFLFRALDPEEAIDHDPEDAEGLRRCLRCNKGRVPPRYGAANDFCRLPDFDPQRLARTGERGMSSPTKDDVFYVLRYMDALRRRLLAGDAP